MARKKIVVMPVIPVRPGIVQRPGQIRSNLNYARYGKVTWEWWCKLHNIHFIQLDKPQGGKAYSELPPTMQRWLALELLLKEFGTDTQIAMVDADTMVRWDTPDFFDLAGPHLAAVVDVDPEWIFRSIRAYQQLFPGVALPWWEYFNAGLVVLGQAQLHVIQEFLALVVQRWPEIQAIRIAAKAGTDQTLLNFMVRRSGQSVHYLPRPFNLVHCFPLSASLRPYETSSPFSLLDLPCDGVTSIADNFDFIDIGYIWHFTNVGALRYLAMKATWHRIREHYLGSAECD